MRLASIPSAAGMISALINFDRDHEPEMEIRIQQNSVVPITEDNFIL